MKPAFDVNRLLRQLIDCLILEISYLLACHYIGMKLTAGIHLQLMVVSMLIWTIGGAYVHLYDDYRSRPFSYEFVAILKTSLLHVFLLTFAVFYFFKYLASPRTFLLAYSAYIFPGMLLSKFVIKKFMLKLWIRGYNQRNMLIVGAGETGLRFHHTIQSNDHFGYRCVGFVDDCANPSLNGQYLGRLSELKQILEVHEVDDVIVALPESTREETEHIILTSEKATSRVRIIANCYQHCTTTVSMSLFGTFPLITVRSSPLDDPSNQQLKRIFDVVFTLILMAAFSWLFLLIALLIKLTSGGPVIYKQERYGFRNKRLTFYKFRTMVVDHEKADSSVFTPTARNDARITVLGRFLRRTSLDELPQFFNVLKGEMSFVGPRPHATPMHMELKETIQHYMLRHLVKPGITGWAQVNGCRGEGSNPEQLQRRINLDIWYIENYSFWLDWQIIAQTMVNLIKGDKNAY
ncbi:undecaprenyl-phosphate glucose phosphotransferase [Chitinophaga eiseniae]|uniref:Undecaprenyl-phosphate glucose phosphotransferase n=1 Tax=Chitinophaga eiseniae TaxID=634771 RepID=A0A847SVT9_9BACT|nr:undecaprenyl-phosphate glucose phosphotransferase [Chitinophaga eiseniae]NLR80992.1 undecaprenyl-phosphate glucose phosphotransferase [Chitinophaga eiseniae]